MRLSDPLSELPIQILSADEPVQIIPEPSDWAEHRALQRRHHLLVSRLSKATPYNSFFGWPEARLIDPMIEYMKKEDGSPEGWNVTRYENHGVILPIWKKFTKWHDKQRRRVTLVWIQDGQEMAIGAWQEEKWSKQGEKDHDYWPKELPESIMEVVKNRGVSLREGTLS